MHVNTCSSNLCGQGSLSLLFAKRRISLLSVACYSYAWIQACASPCRIWIHVIPSKFALGTGHHSSSILARQDEESNCYVFKYKTIDMEHRNSLNLPLHSALIEAASRFQQPPKGPCKCSPLRSCATALGYSETTCNIYLGCILLHSSLK